MFFVGVHWMEFVSRVKFRQLQTQCWAYQNNTFSFATRLGWLATEFYDYTLSISLPMLNLDHRCAKTIDEGGPLLSISSI